MLRRCGVLCDTFKEHYHRVNLPRRLQLERFKRREEAKLAKSAAAAAAAGSSSSTTSGMSVVASGAAPLGTVPYQYNRWWVSNDHAFVHQHAFVEDPDVTHEKRTTLPHVTKENIWREPQKTFFMPFAPYIRVVDYPKDPDVKFMRPVNVPRWKDYMQRTKPVVPRTWY